MEVIENIELVSWVKIQLVMVHHTDFILDIWHLDSLVGMLSL